jgi:hypothetical protein
MNSKEENYIKFYALKSFSPSSPNYYADIYIAHGGEYKNQKLTNEKNKIGSKLVQILKEEKTIKPFHLVSDTDLLNDFNLETIKKVLSDKFPQSKFYLEKKV